MGEPGAADRMVRVPADVELEDHLLGRLTARQLVIIAASCLPAWVMFTAARHVVGWQAAAGIGLALVAAGGVLALGRVDGVRLDRLAPAAFAQAVAPNRLVPAPAGRVDAPPAFVDGSGAPRPPAPLRLPGHAVARDGVVDLGADGYAVLLVCDPVCFALRTEAEQDALTAAYGRWLNGLTRPAQILVRARRIDLGPRIAGLRKRAPSLPHPRLETAARAHADFLAGVAARRDLLTHEVLLVLREPAGPPARRVRPDEAGTVLRRRADDARQALRGAGVTARILPGEQVWAALAAGTDPTRSPGPGRRAAPEDVVSAAARHAAAAAPAPNSRNEDTS